MNAILIFALATIINVTLSTIRSICTIKCGKWLSALSNAVCYGFYPLIVMLTANGTVDIIINMCITAVANFVCVWLIKLVEEKARKDKMWKIEMAIPLADFETVQTKMKRTHIPFNYVYMGGWVMFNCYCETQVETAECVKLCKSVGGKISAYESKGLGL
jgi:hypothetical protein